MKKINSDEELRKALESCANVLSLAEVSRITGIRLELLRRFINRTANDAKAETWDKIYPVLKPYILGEDDSTAKSGRIGPAYRHHAELVDMISDQKVLLDEFNTVNAQQQNEIINILSRNCQPGWSACSFSSLSAEENRMMGAYFANPEADREQKVLEVTAFVTEILRKKRNS